MTNPYYLVEKNGNNFCVSIVSREDALQQIHDEETRQAHKNNQVRPQPEYHADRENNIITVIYGSNVYNILTYTD